MRLGLCFAALSACLFAIAGCAGQYERVLNNGQTGPIVESLDNAEAALFDYVISIRRADELREYKTLCVAERFDDRFERVYRPIEHRQLQALKRRHPRVDSVDSCEKRGENYVDAAGNLAAMVDIHEFTCSSPIQCTGWAGFVGNARSNGWTYFNMRYDGRWRIRIKDLGIVTTGNRQ